ncbi:hypothetical protein AB0L70_15340 [Kribbella sp. NPDC051952]|uniref:hypothetical protein n=1 Tax=Kribbella sp. NPDC051952 TaxID=3154851 RepID=UPI0034463657
MDRDDLTVRLWEATSSRRADRRSYEWKVTLGLWAGLLAVAKLALDSTALPLVAQRWAVVVVACLLLVIVAVGHWLYEFKFVVPANAHDLEEALTLEGSLRETAHLPSAEADERTWRRAPALFQVGVTVLLTVVAAGSIIIGSR